MHPYPNACNDLAYEFEIRRDNIGWLVAGIILFVTHLIVHIRTRDVFSLLIAGFSILTGFALYLLLLPRDLILVRGDTLHVVKRNTCYDIKLSDIIEVILVYGKRMGWQPYLDHLRIKYLDKDRVKTLKLGTFSWDSEGISELYRYLNLFKGRYEYKVYVKESWLPELLRDP